VILPFRYAVKCRFFKIQDSKPETTPHLGLSFSPPTLLGENPLCNVVFYIEIAGGKLNQSGIDPLVSSEILNFRAS
jgi:hypothetical protein